VRSRFGVLFGKIPDVLTQYGLGGVQRIAVFKSHEKELIKISAQMDNVPL
jgi:hypothetical protein